MCPPQKEKICNSLRNKIASIKQEQELYLQKEYFDKKNSLENEYTKQYNNNNNKDQKKFWKKKFKKIWEVEQQREESIK